MAKSPATIIKTVPSELASEILADPDSVLPAFPETITQSPAQDASTPETEECFVAPAVAFQRFRKLPVELRAMILKFLIEDGSDVEVSHTGITTARDRRNESSSTERNTQAWCKVSSPPPAILHVNKECREISLKSYKVFRSGRLTTPFYFNSAADRFCITSIGCAYALMHTGGHSDTWTALGVKFLDISISSEPDKEFYKKLSGSRSLLAERAILKKTWKSIIEYVASSVLVPVTTVVGAISDFESCTSVRVLGTDHAWYKAHTVFKEHVPAEKGLVMVE
ncbi:hypothetical protein MBM_03265 [Drepanopeziza brunnea f. sp. 'multigermtubi' MB_m1]|uniref:2EXR domain-containing protein n=1 Tax=Marssonina brunnea f. sp. multigermtubi (strain MB_m1) TaxID=1072389 RepID=K1X002_MARBU|nr:uncharacterized protein MBM_03265 [Drepanopeziza brunnea f. sp. 'multigermtubi' MB_m1]EKD18272.1 hypothetical protein MBM_03265 [Drepanopeziza brunnea f. sp. 'multigermtubi' MB_m1]